MTDSVSIAVTAVIGLLTVAGSYASVKVARRNARVQETDVVTDAALSLLEPLRHRITELEVKVDHLESELQKSERERNQLVRWAATLQAQLTNAGIDPITLAEIRHLDGM